MSYILDALKKADAERERDAAAVPDLHAQGDAARSDRRSTRPAGLALLAMVAAAIALGVLGWRWFATAPTEEPPPPMLGQAPAPLPASLPAPLPAPMPTPMAAPAPVQAVRPAPAMPSATRPVVPAPAPGPALSRAKPVDAAPRAAVSAPLASAAVPAQPTRPASVASDSRLPTLAELPAELRGQLPALAVGGSVYSPRAASRIVILNGQVFREGDKPVEGLTVEQIRLKSTVLVFRGQRFELKH